MPFTGNDRASLVEAQLRRLRDSHAALLDSERELRRTVVEARRAGATWREVGEVLGVSRQAAYDRFGHRRPATGS